MVWGGFKFAAVRAFFCIPIQNYWPYI
eukprot:SAG11_NODE_29866_length_306_cov_0.942029_1_plen_26_part_10